MTDRIPLFPLGTVLFPGLLLPLHVFEERYRTLVRDLEEEPDTDARRFGVVAIREGHEVGDGAATALHEVGCVAQVRQADEREDGTIDLVTVGAARFRVDDVDDSGPYLTGAVTLLDEPEGDGAEVLADAVRQAFTAYRQALLDVQGRTAPEVGGLPEDPVTLSYLVAAATVLFVPDKQRLLAEPSAAARLGRELEVLRREVALLRRLPSVPAVELLAREVTSS
ncbi:MAG: LON peptidase substrate-binding domain-containing protein [Actinomycetes bacterium]